MTKIFLRAFLKISHPQYVYTPLLWPLVLLYYNVKFYKNIFGEQNLHKSIFPGDALLFGFLNPFPPPQFWEWSFDLIVFDTKVLLLQTTSLDLNITTFELGNLFLI